ncbi:response regulator [Aestuariirhabdus sp. LZHN29]|uniref:response regulator n=1 Tax=Aestuariirhabdus sp. LZHN29 TaxID=3417462 RepID=UPI003CFAFEDD
MSVESAAAINSSSRPHVLVVDDEPRVLRSLRAAFKSRYNISTANDASEARQLIGQGASFDVIVSDERMPNERGHELLTWARQHQPGSVRILLSGTDFKQLEAAIEGAEVFRCLSKPWDLQEFGQVLDQAVEQSRQQTHLLKPEATAGSSCQLAVLDPDIDYQALYSTLAESIESVESVQVAQSPEALYELLEHSNPVGVVCLDLALGAETVQNLMQHLQGEYPAIEVLVTASPASARDYLAQGGRKPRQNIILKPVSAARLQPAINSAAVRALEAMGR